MRNKDSYTKALSRENIENRAEKILSEGLKSEKSFFLNLNETVKNLGFKVIFHDIIELLIISFIMMFLFFNIAISIRENPGITDSDIYMITFIISPLLQLITSIFGLFNTRQNHTYELEMTFKHDILKLAAFRMFIFSIVTVLFNTLVVVFLIISDRNIDIVRLWSISMVSVFLFSSLFLYFIIKVKKRWSKYLFIVLWLGINTIIFINFMWINKVLIINMPVFVHLGIALMCTVFYINNLKSLISFRSLRGEM